jgi:hypothetical protein
LRRRSAPRLCAVPLAHGRIHLLRALAGQACVVEGIGTAHVLEAVDLGLADAGLRAGEAAVVVQRIPERGDGAVRLATQQQLQATQVRVERGDVAGRRQAPAEVFAGVGQHAHQRRHDFLGDVALRGEDIRHVVLVRAAPQRVAAARVGQPRTDAHPLAFAPDAGVQHGGHAKALAHRPGIRACHRIGREPGRHLQPPHAGQRGMQLRRQPFGEIAVAAAVAQRGERQHRDRRFRGAGHRATRRQPPGQEREHPHGDGRHDPRPGATARARRAFAGDELVGGLAGRDRDGCALYRQARSGRLGCRRLPCRFDAARVRLLRRDLQDWLRLGRQLADEPVPQRMLGLDVARVLGVVAEGRTQLGDDPGQDARGNVAMTPDQIQQFVPADQFASATQQDEQDGEGLRLHRVVGAVSGKSVRGCVDDDVVETVALGRRPALACHPEGVHRQNLMATSPSEADGEERRARPS